MGGCVELDEYATMKIGDNCSFKALNSYGEIIGVTLNAVERKPVGVSTYSTKNLTKMLHEN